MRTLVVGGHSRNIGKTALAVDILRAFPEARWRAVKITQYGHGICSIGGARCGCAPAEHAFALDEERDTGGRTDTSRLLVAGAERAFWLRSKQGQMAAAMPLLRQALEGAEFALLESNTVLQFLRPDFYVVVLDPAQADFKDSARYSLDCADALVLRAPLEASAWPGISPRLLEGTPRFEQPVGAPLPAGLLDLVRRILFAETPAA